MSKAIDDEPSIVAPQAHRHAPMRLGLSGLAVAAAVASVVLVALPYFSESGAVPSQVQIVASADNDAGLRDYLEAHRHITGISPVRQVSFDAGAAREWHRRNDCPTAVPDRVRARGVGGAVGWQYR